jgi:outer membrane protein assembly factor BamA
MKASPPSLLHGVLLAAFCVLFSQSCIARQQTDRGPVSAAESTSAAIDRQEAPTAGAAHGTTDSRPIKKKKVPPRGAFVVAPLPISSPALGTGLVPAVGYIFPFSTKDKVSPPSVIGAAGLITDNGSRGFALAAQLYFKENRYRVTSGYVRGNLNYDIYSSGTAINAKLPLNQTGQAFFIEGLRNVGWHFFVGPRLLTGNSFLTIRPTDDTTFPIPPEVGLHSTLTALGAKLTRDTSLNRFYPTSGTYIDFTADFFSEALGSKYTFQSYNATFSKYWGVSDKQVLAYNGFFCGTGGTPPFYGYCIYGTDNQLRGYIAGEYFTQFIVATQLEYRLELPKRFGLVVFGGIGEIIPGAEQVYGTQKFLPSGGAGLRFQLDKKHHVNLRADIAQGRDGHTFGLGIGEAF